MPSLQDVRQQYPQYSDMPDAALADALYKKFYSDIPRAEFDAKLGLSSEQPSPPQRGVMDKLTGRGGERYQTWPERLVRGIGQGAADFARLPGRVMQEAQQAPPQISDSDVSVLSVPQALNFAGFATPVNPMVRSGDKAIPGAAHNFVPGKAEVPTTEQLAKTGGEQIQAAKQSGLDIDSRAVSQFAAKVKRDLFEAGIHPVDAQATFTKLAELENAPPGSFVTAANLQSLRESLAVTAQNFNQNSAKDQLAASRAINQLDQLIPSLNPKDVLAGTPATTQQLFEQGRGNYAAAMRSNSLTGNLDRANTGLIERAETRAQATHSGRNIDNTLRQRLASLLEKPKEVSGFSDPEIAALNQSIAGSKPRNAARVVGNKLGGGGGAGQTALTLMGAGAGAGAGIATGNPYMGMAGAVAGGAIPETVGTAARALANALAKKSVRNVDELVRMRSPLYQEALQNAGQVGAPVTMQEAIIRALMGSQAQPQQ